MSLLSLLKLGALARVVRRRLLGPAPIPRGTRPRTQPGGGGLPVVSLLVPLYREENIAGRLIRRLEALRYPRARLDLCLLVEAGDARTARALSQARLAPWMRVITVPEGSIRTKPRAMNYALPYLRGSLVGVYDAEDAPDPEQIAKVVRRFDAADQGLACLQGRLDFYNPATNLLARGFTLDYGSWFRIVLPGIERLGLILPLGGTTLFVRRAALEHVGGWDAHNVTEDADLGVRLARFGYRTEMIASTTWEEANCRLWPWVRQRSRWLKGYLVTLIVAFRRPRLLLRQIGARRAAGLLVLLGGTLVYNLLAPLVWLLPPLVHFAGWPRPGYLPLWMIAWLTVGGGALLAVNLACDITGARMGRHRGFRRYAPIMPLYHLLATLALYRALLDLAVRPFHWDKTAHGLTPQARRARAPVQLAGPPR